MHAFSHRSFQSTETVKQRSTQTPLSNRREIRNMVIFRTLLLLAAVVVITIVGRSTYPADNNFNALMDSGVRLCSADPPTVTETKTSLIHCATRCASLTSCAHFNYRNKEKTCELYQFAPDCFYSTPTCSHYQVNSNSYANRKSYDSTQPT